MMLRGAYDFIGINHYTTWYASRDSTNIIGVLLNDTLADSGAITLRMFFLCLTLDVCSSSRFWPFSTGLVFILCIFYVFAAIAPGKPIYDRVSMVKH